MSRTTGRSHASPRTGSRAIRHPEQELQDALTVKEICDRLKIARSTFYEWRQKKVGPPCISLPNGQLRVVPSDFEEWLNSRKDWE